MKRFFIGIVLVVVFAFFAPRLFASETPTPASSIVYETGVVTKIVTEQQIMVDSDTFYVQTLQAKRSGADEVVELTLGSEFQPLTASQRLSVGDQVILTEQETTPGSRNWVASDIYRLPLLLWLMLGFFALVLVVAGLKGILSIIGMFVSLAVLVAYVIPAVLTGGNPIVVSLVGAAIIGGVTVYLSHGFSIKSHIAFGSMMATLLVVTILAWWYVVLAKLMGLGSEEAYFLQFGQTASVNLQGLLLGGIMLGALGVLDDITVSQVAIIFELKKANPKLSFGALYEAGMRVGRDHVASLVNTLVLAYAGSNLPLFLLFTLAKQTPAWVHLSTELLAEEIVRTLVGSIGLVLAVPLTTVISAYWASRGVKIAKVSAPHAH